MKSTLKLVFSKSLYLILACAIFTIMLTVLLIISEFVFLSPYFIAYVSPGTEIGFFLIVILSGLSALVIPMNIFRIHTLKKSRGKMTGGVFGSFFGAIAGACSCGPIGFAVISTFGSVGATASAFLTNFELPIRIAAIILLLITYFTTIKSLNVECKIKT